MLESTKEMGGNTKLGTDSEQFCYSRPHSRFRLF